MTVIPHFQTMTRSVGIFIFEGFQLLDAAGPITALEIASRHRDGAYYVTVVSAAGGSVRSSAGVAWDSVPLRSRPPFDTLIVVGGLGSDIAMQSAESLDVINAQAAAARRVCGVCSGGLILAAAGLLSGRRATTHWTRAERLQRDFPAVKIDADRIYVRDGPIWTSAGITAGIDLTLALIAEDLGEAIARQAACEMVVYYRRPGGQSQFSVIAELSGEANEFSELLGWLRANLTAPLTVEFLADRMAMSPRNFARAVTRAVGFTPAKMVERLRLEVARERVESSRVPIEVIAAGTGFRDPERMRRAFLRAFGLPPQALRRSAYANRNAPHSGEP